MNSIKLILLIVGGFICNLAFAQSSNSKAIAVTKATSINDYVKLKNGYWMKINDLEWTKVEDENTQMPKRLVEQNTIGKPNITYSNSREVFSVYPNPSNGISNIQINSANGHHLEYAIYTLSGQQMQEGNMILNDNDQGQIDYQTLPEGVYILKVNVGGQEQALKLLKM